MFASGSTAGGRHVFVMPSHRIYADTLARLSPWLQVLPAEKRTENCPWITYTDRGRSRYQRL
eukprot:COSAG03_NODE_1595_length_3813_cov_1.276521_1_plen_61_part_10